MKRPRSDTGVNNARLFLRVIRGYCPGVEQIFFLSAACEVGGRTVEGVTLLLRLGD